MDELMPIGEFSERSGLSARRLRSYAAEGLLVPAAVDSGSGYRYYAPGQLRAAKLIDALRRGGMPLAQIGEFLRDPASNRIDAWVRQIADEAVQRQQALDAARRLSALDVSRESRYLPERSAMFTLQTAARSDVGRVRETNQDVVLSRPDLVGLADGMGGGPAGEVAAAVAITTVDAAFTGRSLDELTAGVRAANRVIWDQASARAEFEGMGTTCCAVAVTDGGDLAIVNVGDSRAYLLRDGRLRRLTDDHSVTAELVRRGELSEAEAVGHPHHNVLTRVLGAGPDVEVDGATEPARDRDRLLLCTDGLFNEVPESQIAAVMTETADPRAAASDLIEQALSNGGRDNVSVVIADLCAVSVE